MCFGVLLNLLLIVTDKHRNTRKRTRVMLTAKAAPYHWIASQKISPRWISAVGVVEGQWRRRRSGEERHARVLADDAFTLYAICLS